MVLSNEDIINELGRNIFIYPLDTRNIRGSTINLTASRFAWSAFTGEKIITPDGDSIKIPSLTTALIETNETIYVSNKICGSYHSKVRKVSVGLSHIGSTLDPLYIGPSLIAVTNHHPNKDAYIGIGDTFVSLMLFYLKNNTTKESGNAAGHLPLLSDFDDYNTIEPYLDQDWCKIPGDLKQKMLSSESYKQLEKQRVLKRKSSSSYYFKCTLIYLGLFALFCLIGYGIYAVETGYIQPQNLIITYFYLGAAPLRSLQSPVIPVPYKS